MSGQRATSVTEIAASACAVFLIMTRASLSSAAEPTMMIGCYIRATETNNALRLDAVANGRHAVTGTYSFDVFKQSSGGTSQNVQSGAFELDADRDEILSTVILDGAARGHYRARLTLNSQEFGSVSCVSP